MTDDGHQVERRSVLKTIAAGGAIAAGVGQASAAGTSPGGSDLSLVNAAQERFGDVASVEELFSSYGQPVEDALVELGYLESGASVSVDSVVSRRNFGKTSEGNVAMIGDGGRDGTHVVDVRVRQLTGDYEIEYHLNPGMGDGYALVHGDDETTLVLPDGTENVVTTDYCCPDGCSCGEYRCTNEWCYCQNLTNYYDRERYCCVNDDGTCYCSWERSSEDDCACTEYIGACPK